MKRRCRVRRFQFQTGAIKSSQVRLSRWALRLSFNSKLVRLKVTALARISAWFPNAFQFQTGAIKRPDESKSPRVPVASFNSKLVRLKGIVRLTCSSTTCWFQFQTGAIKRSLLPAVAPLSYPRFNSKLVRLKVVTVPTAVVHELKSFNSKLVRLKVIDDVVSQSARYSVSIPNWCD